MISHFIFLLIFIFSFCVNSHLEKIITHPKLIVQTKWATIRGDKENFNNCSVHVFRGIPYALPPVGILRFSRTFPLLKNHRGIFNATKFGPECMQESNDPIMKHENCLQINIWTPSKVNKKESLPVILFLHGSIFTHGSSTKSKYNGAYFACLGKVIFASFNHRLGAFGYLAGGRKACPGNQALYDIEMAIQWIHDNIPFFGGDSNRITLYGFSSGSVELALLLIKRQKDYEPLFQRVILSSGSPIGDEMIEPIEKSIERAQKLTSLVGCDHFNDSFNFQKFTRHYKNKLTNYQLKCLLRLNATIIAHHQNNANLLHANNAPFIPVYGDNLITEKYDNYFRNKSFVENVPMLIGDVTYEVPDYHLNIIAKNASSKIDFINYFKKNAKHLFTKQIYTNINRLLKAYFNDINDDDINASLERSAKFLADINWHCKTLVLASAYASKNPTYIYRFTYSINNQLLRPTHQDDIMLLFADPFRNPDKYSDNDRKVTQEMVRIWSHFAYGKELWEQVKSFFGSTILKVYEINPNIQEKLHTDESFAKCQLWADIMNYTI